MTTRVQARDIRVDGPLGPAVDGLSLELDATRAVIAGASPELAEALAGTRPVVRGRLDVAGRTPEAARREGLVALAARRSLPAAFTLLESATLAARLAGKHAEAARRGAEAALAALRLAGDARTRVSRLSPLARRAGEVACALATGAPTLVLDDPLGDLDDTQRETLEPVLVEALGGLGWILVAREARERSALVARAHELVLVEGNAVVLRGAPTGLPLAGRWVLRVLAHEAEVASRLEHQGLPVERGEGRLVLELGGDDDAARVVALCASLDAPVVELRAVFRGAPAAKA